MGQIILALLRMSRKKILIVKKRLKLSTLNSATLSLYITRIIDENLELIWCVDRKLWPLETKEVEDSIHSSSKLLCRKCLYYFIQLYEEQKEGWNISLEAVDQKLLSFKYNAVFFYNMSLRWRQNIVVTWAVLLFSELHLSANNLFHACILNNQRIKTPTLWRVEI